MPRRKKTDLRLLKYAGIVARNHLPVDYENVSRKEMDEIIIEKDKDFKRYNVLAKAEDIALTNRPIKNRSFSELRSGFLTTENKEKYIRENKENIKTLLISEQTELFKLFLQFIE